MYLIEQNSKIPLHIQLFEQIKEEIISSKKVGDKLNSIRKVAQEYNLSKTTVESAYSQLVAEGYIDSYPKSAYVVSDINHKVFKSKIDNNFEVEEKEESFLYDFFPARLEKDSFPLKIWKRMFNKAIDDSIDFGMYKNGQGEYGLRVQVAKYLIESRALKCKPSQIIICNGFADSMALLARLIKDRYKSFAIEHPGYHIARKVFEDYNFSIEKIPLEADGLNLEKLKQSNSKLVYVTASHQYPMGIAMSISKRMKLLEWAKNNEAFIIEDDYDSELSYSNRPIPSLQGLDEYNRVIYAGTFSKALSPALRVSYLVLPEVLIEKFKETYESRTSRVCISTQKTLELFIKEGYWIKHLRKIRTLNKKKHNLMKKLLKEKLGDTFKIESSGGGLAILINPTVSFDWKILEAEAKKQSIKLHLAKKRVGDEWQGLMMGFGGFKIEEIENAVDVFSKVWNKALI